MARKPAVMYRRLKGPAYTRRKYIGGVPNNRIMQFHVGNRRAAETGEFQVVLELRADNDVQIRHTALEAARVVSISTIRKDAGAQGYALRVHTFPHHVLRENKQATGAGADRVSQGMRCAFGKNVGTAARVKRGQRVISIHVDAPHYLTARDALRKATMKFPTPCTVRLILDMSTSRVSFEPRRIICPAPLFWGKGSRTLRGENHENRCRCAGALQTQKQRF